MEFNLFNWLLIYFVAFLWASTEAVAQHLGLVQVHLVVALFIWLWFFSLIGLFVCGVFRLGAYLWGLIFRK